MEQLVTHQNLSEKEKKNVYLAVAIGALNTINQTIPGPAHQRKKRVLQQLSKDLLRYCGPRIPRVHPRNMDIFRDSIIASGTVLDQILKETNQMGTHVLLNLVGFCLDELPVARNLQDRYNKLFDMWENAMQYNDTRSGDRIFQRIDAEVETLVAQRGGYIF